MTYHEPKPNILHSGEGRRVDLENDIALSTKELEEIRSKLLILGEKGNKALFICNVLIHRGLASEQEILDFNAELSKLGLTERLSGKN